MQMAPRSVVHGANELVIFESQNKIQMLMDAVSTVAMVHLPNGTL